MPWKDLTQRLPFFLVNPPPDEGARDKAEGSQPLE